MTDDCEQRWRGRHTSSSFLTVPRSKRETRLDERVGSAPNGIFDLEIKNVVFVGAGFVGGPSAAVLASRIENIDVTVVDVNPARIQAWNSDDLPVSEPGLHELVRAHRTHSDSPDCCDWETTSYDNDLDTPYGSTHKRKNLHFSTSVTKFIRSADVIFLCVDTPQSLDCAGMNGKPNLSSLKKAVQQIGAAAVKDFVIVEKSTVPSGTAAFIRNLLQHSVQPGIEFEILSNPEFLAEGRAIKDLERPDRVLVGASRTPAGRYACDLLTNLYRKWIPSERIITSDTWSAELGKLCSNALLAQRISSINSFSMICDHLDADVREVAQIVKSDSRIGTAMLSPSVGFGGSCFQKDVAHLAYLAESLGLHEVAQYWRSVLQINQLQKETFADRICKRLAEHAEHMTGHIAILGFTFKSETNDVRNSPAIDVTKRLLKDYRVRVYDPCGSEKDIFASLEHGSEHKPVDTYSSVEVCSSAYVACEGAAAVVILTDWDEFKFGSPHRRPSQLQGEADLCSVELASASSGSPDSGIGHSPERKPTSLRSTTDWKRISRLMQEPKFLFDGRNVIHDSIADLGFEVERIGKRPNNQDTLYSVEV